MVVKKYGMTTMLAMATTVFLWSTTFAGLTAALDHFSWGHLLFARWTLTALIFLVYGVATGMRLPASRDLPRIAAAGFFGFTLYQLLLVSGQTGVSATMAGFLINLSPVFTTVLVVLLGREHGNLGVWAGLAVCTVGIAIMGDVVTGGVGAIGPGSLLVAGAALSFSLYALVSRPLLQRYTAIEVTAYSVIVGAIPFVVFSPGSMGALRSAAPEGIATLVYLAVVPGAVAYVLWSRSLKGLTPGIAARFLYLIPVLGVVVSWVWVGETPGISTAVGGVVVLVGVALASGALIRRPPRVLAPLPGTSRHVVREAA